MNTQEHLTTIRAKCVELLATAKLRTPGTWHTHSDWPRVLSEVCAQIAQEPTKLTQKTKGPTSPNIIFIASCAGPAEAGWAATIAAIDGLLRITKQGPVMGSVGTYREGQLDALEAETEHAKEAINNIIAAWPEELLK